MANVGQQRKRKGAHGGTKARARTEVHRHARAGRKRGANPGATAKQQSAKKARDETRATRGLHSFNRKIDEKMNGGNKEKMFIQGKYKTNL